MAFNPRRFKQLLTAIATKMNLVQKVTPPSTPVPDHKAQSTQGIKKANRRLESVLREFRNIHTNINTSDFTHAVAQAERRLSDAVSDAKGATDDVKKAMVEAARTSERMKDLQLFTAYPKAFKDHAKGFTQKYGEMVKLISDKAQIQLSTDEVLKIQDGLGRTYDNAKSLLEKAAAFGLDQDRALTAEESKLANYIEAQLHKEMRQLDIFIQNAEETTDIARALGEAAEAKAMGMTKDTRDFVADLRHIKDQFERRDFVGAAKGVAGLKGKGKAPGMQALNKASAGMGKAMAAMMVVEMVVKAVKQAVGYFLSLNSFAADLNKKVSEVHGLVSQGIDVTARIDGKAIEDNAKKYQKLFLEFGVDSGTFLKPEQLLSITGAYEAQGVKLKELTRDEAGFKQKMQDVVGYSLMTGMSYESLAGIMADWQQNINMDTGAIAASMNAFVATQIDTGMPAEILYETTKTLNFDYSLWGASMMTALAMQKHNLQKGKGTVVAKNKSLQALLDHIKGLDAFNYELMLDHLPSGAFNELVDKDIAIAQKMYQGAMNDTDKSKWKHTLSKLNSVKKLDHVRAMKLYFDKDVASMEARLSVFQKSLKSGFKGLDKTLKDSIMSTSMEQNLRTFMGAEGMSDKDFAEIMLGVANIVLSYFDPYTAIDGAELSAEEKKKQEELRRKAIEAAMPQLKTFKELQENFWNKIMAQILQKADKIIGFLRGLLLLNPFGSGDDLDPGSEARKAEAESSLIENIMKASQMESGKDRDKAVQELANFIGSAKAEGVDIQSVATRMEEQGVADDIIKRLRASSPEGSRARGKRAGDAKGMYEKFLGKGVIHRISGLERAGHQGLDLQKQGDREAPIGSMVYAPSKVKIESVADLPIGRMIVLRDLYDPRVTYTFHHMTRRDPVSVGDVFEDGDGIARVGGTDEIKRQRNWQGVHLHVEKRVSGKLSSIEANDGAGGIENATVPITQPAPKGNPPATQPAPKVNPNPGSAGSNQPSTASSAPGAQAASIAHRNNQHNKCIKVKLNGNMMCQADADALKKKAAKK